MLERIKNMADLFPYCLTIVDTYKKGSPCIYANKNFYLNTGYNAEYALGKNLSFLQGKLTDQSTREFMRDSMNKEKACIQDIINYKKDGTIFLNRLLLLPIKSQGSTLYLGIQNDMTEQKSLLYRNDDLKRVTDEEIKHHVNNTLTIALNAHSLILSKSIKEEDEKQHKIWDNFNDGLIRMNDFALNIERISDFENFKYV